MTRSGPTAAGTNRAGKSEAMLLLARRIDLSPRVRNLLNGMLERASSHFEIAIARALDETEHEFFKLAERADNNERQQKHFENLREAKLGRPDVVPRFLQYTESGLAHLRDAQPPVAPAAPARSRAKTLELIDSDVLEQDLALQEIASKSEIRHSIALHSLSQRIGVIAGSPAVPIETLPLGPAQLAAAFCFALQDIALDAEHRVLAYRQFDRIAMLPVGPLYDELNGYLAAQRVLPHLRFQSARRIGEFSREETPAQDSAARRDAASDETFTTSSSAAPEGGDQDLFKTLRHLLGQRHDAEGERHAAQRPDAHYASQGDLQSVLGGLQRGTASTRALDNEHFKNTLRIKLRRVSPQGRPLDIAEEDSDTIDLVGMLFDHITREMRSGSGAQDLLGRLHVPVLRVALGDKTFFTRRDHPARALLNTIAETGVHWIDDSDSDPELIGKMQRVVEHVGTSFDGDLGVFEKLLDELGLHMQSLARRAEIAERRHVDAARGRDKLEIARETARTAIVRVLQRGTTNPTVRALLERAWTDALALSALRQGEHGSEFKRRVAVAESLVQHANPPTQAVDESMRNELDAGLRQVGLHDDDVRSVLDNLLSPPGKVVSNTETLDRIGHALRDKTRLGGDAAKRAAGTATAAAPAKVALTAAEIEAFEKLRKLPFGTWFDFVTNQQGSSVRRKLAWYSTVTGHCLFVNQRGARDDDKTLEQLARDLARGQARIVSTERTSLIDRAWKAIVETLRPRATEPATATST